MYSDYLPTYALITALIITGRSSVWRGLLNPVCLLLWSSSYALTSQAIGRKSTTNGILSCKASEKSLKSHKRVAVGFALDDGCDAGGEGVELEQPACGGGGVPEGPTLRTDSASSLDTRELNPEDHMELEHMASVSAMLEQRTMPVVVKLTSP